MCRVLCLCHVWTGCSPLSVLLNPVQLPSDLLPAFSASMFLGASQIPLTLYTGKEAAPSL